MCEEFGAGFGGQPSHELSDAAAKRSPESESSAETPPFRAHWESRFNPNGNRSSCGNRAEPEQDCHHPEARRQSDQPLFCEPARKLHGNARIQGEWSVLESRDIWGKAASPVAHLHQISQAWAFINRGMQNSYTRPTDRPTPSTLQVVIEVVAGIPARRHVQQAHGTNDPAT